MDTRWLNDFVDGSKALQAATDRFASLGVALDVVSENPKQTPLYYKEKADKIRVYAQTNHENPLAALQEANADLHGRLTSHPKFGEAEGRNPPLPELVALGLAKPKATPAEDLDDYLTFD